MKPNIVSIRRIIDRVFHLLFKTQGALASTFLRFQEHYESPVFRGKVFARAEFVSWYRARHGAFTYHEDWGGFNIPSYVLAPFFDGRFDPLSHRERRLLELFEDRRGDTFYVIGTFKGGDNETLKHEIAHGLFHTDLHYRRRVLAVLDDADAWLIEEWQEHLAEYYHPAVWRDEIHAHLVDAAHSVEPDSTRSHREWIARRLNRIFEEHFCRRRADLAVLAAPRMRKAQATQACRTKRPKELDGVAALP